MMQTLKRCSSSSAETILDYEDIIMEILVRVPARPLLRCKCVSKYWLSLISNPNFCRIYTLRNPRPPIFTFVSDVSTNFNFVSLDPDHCLSSPSPTNNGNQNLTKSATCNPLNFVPIPKGVKAIQIVQSCNGLFLCRPELPVTTASSLLFYVLNPTTNNFLTLTPPAAAAASTGQPRIFGYALAFDPSKSPYYKVVFLWFVDEPFAGLWWPYYRIEIYSSETRSWRLLDSSFDTPPEIAFSHGGVYCNGAVHWVGGDYEMCYFHIDEERVGFVDGLPTTRWGENLKKLLFRYFRESHAGGRLHLIDIFRPSPAQFKVLEMGKDYSGWFVKYNVDLDPLWTAHPLRNRFFFTILSLAPDENEEEEEESSSVLLLHIPGKVLSYNLRNNTFKCSYLIPMAGADDVFLCRVFHRNFYYVESLAVV